MNVDVTNAVAAAMISRRCDEGFVTNVRAQPGGVDVAVRMNGTQTGDAVEHDAASSARCRRMQPLETAR